MKKQLLIAGGSGLIGTAIQRLANNNLWEITLLSRDAGEGRIKWSPIKGTIDLPSKMKFDAIINLTGENVSEGRWTDEKKKRIYESRIKAANTLENYLFDGRLSTEVYVGSSAIGIYGDAGEKSVNEKTPVQGNDWFSQVVVDWEKAHQKIEALDIRTIIIRTGIVLSTQGGALKELLDKLPPGVLTYFGSGKQIWSWIHIDDIASIMLYSIEKPNMNGIFLGTAPNPVSNKQLTRSINDNLLSKRILIGVPKFVLALMLGETHHVLFDSVKANSNKIQQEGFVFKYPTIDAACSELLK